MLSLAERAARRAAVVHGDRIRAALAAADSRQALHAAIRHLLGEAKKMRERRPADGALADAQIAGQLTALAAVLTVHAPERPDGCPAIPRSADLLAAFEAARMAYESALEEGAASA